MAYPPISVGTDCLAGQAEDRLINYLATDSDFQALYDGQILNIDPLSISPQGGQNSDGTITIALEVAGEDDEQVTLGLRNIGTRNENYYFLLVIYVDGARDSGKKRELMNFTGKVRKIVRRYIMDTNSGGVWNNLGFRTPATTYHVTPGYSRSVTYGILYGTRQIID